MSESLHGPSANIKDEFRRVCGSSVSYSGPHSTLSQGPDLHSPQTGWNLVMSSSTRELLALPLLFQANIPGSNITTIHAIAAFQILNSGAFGICLHHSKSRWSHGLSSSLTPPPPTTHFDFVEIFLIDVKVPSVQHAVSVHTNAEFQETCFL